MGMVTVTERTKETDTEWQFAMSNVVIPFTIAQCITNLTSHWMAQHMVDESIKHINEWMTLLEDEEVTPMETIHDQRELWDAYPMALLIVTSENDMMALHSIGTATM
jgi:hypothetical protein